MDNLPASRTLEPLDYPGHTLHHTVGLQMMPSGCEEAVELPAFEKRRLFLRPFYLEGG